MESRVKLLGHPIHQILIVIPLGLFIISFIFDLLFNATQDTVLAAVSFYNIAAGIIGGAVAAFFGLIDWLSIPIGTRARRIGRLHGIVNLIVLSLFTISGLIRSERRDHKPSSLALFVSLIGVSLSGLSGWLGGELVDRLSVGVHSDANLNAPSSLLDDPIGKAALDLLQRQR